MTDALFISDDLVYLLFHTPVTIIKMTLILTMTVVDNPQFRYKQ